MGSLLKTLFKSYLPSIHDAVLAGDIGKVMEFLEKNPDLANDRTADRKTPLHVAAGTGQTQIASLLISAGTNVNALDRMSSTALHFAAMHGHKEIIELLLEASASINPLNREGNTPYMLALKNKHFSAEMILKKRGGVVVKKDQRFPDRL